MTSAAMPAATGYVRVPRAWISLSVSPGAKALLLQLCAAANERGESWYSYAQLGEIVRRSRAAVAGYVDELCAAGLDTPAGAGTIRIVTPRHESAAAAAPRPSPRAFRRPSGRLTRPLQSLHRSRGRSPRDLAPSPGLPRPHSLLNAAFSRLNARTLRVPESRIIKTTPGRVGGILIGTEPGPCPSLDGALPMKPRGGGSSTGTAMVISASTRGRMVPCCRRSSKLNEA